mmetsp:Transcript_23639/g.79408  ORF Transcript_23639/g.79408 Transcript_23639/m.79408 type:complete len:261 (+) Transcript_23639:621-1403(+)
MPPHGDMGAGSSPMAMLHTAVATSRAISRPGQIRGYTRSSPRGPKACPFQVRARLRSGREGSKSSGLRKAAGSRLARLMAPETRVPSGRVPKSGKCRGAESSKEMSPTGAIRRHVSLTKLRALLRYRATICSGVRPPRSVCLGSASELSSAQSTCPVDHTAAVVPPMPAKPTTKPTSSDSVATSGRRQGPSSRFMSSRVSAAWCLRRSAVVRRRRDCTGVTSVRRPMRSTRRGMTKSAARDRHWARMAASSSSTQAPKVR